MRSRAMRDRAALVSASVAVVAPIVTWTVAAHRQPAGYSATRQTISALAAHGATDRWVMTLGLYLLGAAHLTTAIVLTEVGFPPRLTLAVGGLAIIAVASLPQPDGGHLEAAAVGFVTLAVWSLGARTLPLIVRIGASALLAALLIWFAVQLGGGQRLGLTERILVAAEALWPLLVVIRSPAPRRST